MASTNNTKNPQSKNIILREAVSLDAPPLDFSYKNIKDLSGYLIIFLFFYNNSTLDVKTMDPRGGKRKPITIDLEESKNDKKKKKENVEVKPESNEKEKEEKTQAQQPGNENTGETNENAAQNNNENQKTEEKNENEDKEKEKEKDKEKDKEKKEENQNQQPAQQNPKKGLEVVRIVPQNNITNTIAAHNIALNNTNTKVT